MSLTDQYKELLESFPTDSTVDDVVSADNSNGWSLDGLWESIGGAGREIFDASKNTLVDFSNMWAKSELGNYLSEGDSAKNTGHTGDDNYHPETGGSNQSGGFSISNNALLIGGGLTVALIAVMMFKK
jgi:hypothetical protein